MGVSTTVESLFEKCAALLYLLIIVGIVWFLAFQPIPPESKEPILLILGVLTGAANTALPRLFGSNKEKDKEITYLKNMQQKSEEQLRIVSDILDNLQRTLVECYVTANPQTSLLDQLNNTKENK